MLWKEKQPQHLKNCSIIDIDVARHEDISDENQSVHIPKIHTTATDESTNDKEGVIGSKVTIKDVVRYENLIPGKEYTVKGSAMVNPGASYQYGFLRRI